MKKFCYIIGIIFLIGGSILFCIGMSKVDWDFKKLDTEEYILKEYVPETVVTSLIFDERQGNVKITKGDKFKISYYESKNDKYSIDLTNGKLLFKNKEEFWFYFGFRFKKSKLTAEITIPENKEIDIKIINISGDISIEGLKFKDIIVNNTSGDILISDVVSNSLKAYNVSGDIEASSIKSTDIIKVKSSSGNIVMDKSECLSLVINNVSGKINCLNCVSNEITAKNVSGDIILSSYRADNFSFETVSGKISGLVLLNAPINDYAITVSTVTGSCNLKENIGTGKRFIKVKSVSGNIRIETITE